MPIPDRIIFFRSSTVLVETEGAFAFCFLGLGAGDRSSATHGGVCEEIKNTLLSRYS